MNYIVNEIQISTAALMAAHRNPLMRKVLALNEWKVVEGLWSFAEWKRHARDYAYHQGPFAAWRFDTRNHHRGGPHIRSR